MAEANQTPSPFRKTLRTEPTRRPPGEDPGRAIQIPPEEYLTISELAARLKYSPKTIQNKMAAGVFKRPDHYLRRKGMAPRFKWSAIVAWLEETESESTAAAPRAIPMARGYSLK